MRRVLAWQKRKARPGSSRPGTSGSSSAFSFSVLLFALSFGTILVQPDRAEDARLQLPVEERRRRHARSGGRLRPAGQPPYLSRHPDHRDRRQEPWRGSAGGLFPAAGTRTSSTPFPASRTRMSGSGRCSSTFSSSSPRRPPEDDALLVSSIRNNGRVFLETVLTLNENPPGTAKEFFGRQDALYANVGKGHEHHRGLAEGHARSSACRLPPEALRRGHVRVRSRELPCRTPTRSTGGSRWSRSSPELEKEIPLDQLTVDRAHRQGQLRAACLDRQGQPVPRGAVPLTPAVLASLKRRCRRTRP